MKKKRPGTFLRKSQKENEYFSKKNPEEPKFKYAKENRNKGAVQ